jgi:hypothetical protein
MRVAVEHQRFLSMFWGRVSNALLEVLLGGRHLSVRMMRSQDERDESR